MTTLAEHIIIAGAENRPPMLEKSMMMLDSIDNGPLVYPTVEEDGQTQPKKYSKLAEAQQLQDDYDQVQVNTKFLNALPPEWSKFVTDVKLAKSLYTTVRNYDQYLGWVLTRRGQCAYCQILKLQVCGVEEWLGHKAEEKLWCDDLLLVTMSLLVFALVERQVVA
ncbi:hypothetical protein Tco_0727653 [Tanacetum coccineum]|uniref:Uncharacterized protein n=1 Tax=Tanacetum coccineum TaxID=301880 RepID=A0ABQ4YLH4_9ASTR